MSTEQTLTLQNQAGLRIQVMDEGATWLSCVVPLPDGTRRELLLGCADAAAYRAQTAYLGAIVGRYANRIDAARFTLDGHEHRLQANEGVNQLHGGAGGFDRCRWTVAAASAQEAVFTLVSPDGDQGFPGEVHATVRYTLGDDLSLTMAFEASTTRACPVCFTSHAYFNLDGGDPGAPDVRGQTLQLRAAHYLPVRDDLIPTGERAPVEGTGFDFRQPRRIGEFLHHDAQQRASKGYDHCWWLDDECAEGRLPAAELQSADGRVTMQLSTDLPALQFYSGNYLAGTPARTGVYGVHGGLALEPQFAPDSPNHPEWPDCILRPGQVYRRFVRLRFVPR